MIRMLITIKDTMAFWDNYVEAYLFNPDGFTSTNTYAYQVPDDWVENGRLTADGFEKVCEQLYGKDWKWGNDDGSKYQILESASEIASPDDTREFKSIDV